MNLLGPVNTGAATGGAGVATANKDSAIRLVGEIMGVYVRYNDSPPAGTTDVTIATKGTGGPPAYNILVLSNAATDGWFYPSQQRHTTAGAAIAGEYTGMLVYDFVNVKIEQANNNDNVDVWFLMR